MKALLLWFLFVVGWIDTCPECEGRGFLRERIPYSCNPTPAIVTCWACNGHGSHSHARKVRA